MHKTINALSIAGALLMAGVPFAGLASAARAQEPASVHISFADLELSRPAEAAVFSRRVDAAARTLCADVRPVGLSAEAACEQIVRREAYDQLADLQRAPLRPAVTVARR